ncbi:hypothetical protein [Agromyces seonyuensis]|uniref:Uncharacterized protein n=1 Tax=Agromyces seonyuensis TaxID=2662446 RepID=A0A6I4NUX5_9MICO|nr:hypothetical protein [Agromyces seonyuensis]MWB98256.1 hypothetical protein [Agromyces seonyuensis]
MRKYLFSGAVLSAIFSGIGIVRSTVSGPRDWRLLLTWVAWAASLAVAIGTVAEDSRAQLPAGDDD